MRFIVRTRALEDELRHGFRLLRAFLIAIVIASCGQNGPTGDPASIKLIDPGEQVQAVPPDEAMALAFSRALDFAAAHGDDVGYPWIDPVTGELVLSAVTPRGRDQLAAENIPVPHRIRDAAYGVAELVRIQHDVTTLRSQGIPGAELIYETLPDHRDNRTLIGISAPSPELLNALVERYDAGALAVRIAPR